ncbi:unnamed protein product [Urochloa decumbens]|uniref:Dirigent protein n=1 Tax=Urochloa decumbens TaxID=240449 RepID=A0ABC8VYR5_9POAL
MAFYAIAALLCTLLQNELYMHLYVNQVSGGANQNQAVVINTGGFGRTAITNWPIADGPAPNATVVGRAQGLHFLSSSAAENSWYTSMNLVFEDTRFAGSSLQVMGTIPKDGQWSISGGTGELTMARGIVNHKVIQQNGSSRIYELDVHAYYTPMNSSWVSGKLGCNSWKLGA